MLKRKLHHRDLSEQLQRNEPISPSVMDDICKNADSAIMYLLYVSYCKVLNSDEFEAALETVVERQPECVHWYSKRYTVSDLVYFWRERKLISENRLDYFNTVYELDPLQFAALNMENPDIIDLLIEKCPGTNINSNGANTRTPLTLAVIASNVQNVSLLLDRYSADPNIAGEDVENTPLIEVRRGIHMFEITKKLLDHGADPKITNLRGKAPIHIAINHNDPDSVQSLLRHGANPNILYYGCPCLNLAIQRRYIDLAIVLVNSGRTNLNLISKYNGFTALHLVADAISSLSYINHDLSREEMFFLVDKLGKLAALLIEKGASLDSTPAIPYYPDENARSPLQILEDIRKLTPPPLVFSAADTHEQRKRQTQEYEERLDNQLAVYRKFITYIVPFLSAHYPSHPELRHPWRSGIHSLSLSTHTHHRHHSGSYTDIQEGQSSIRRTPMDLRYSKQ